MQPSIDNRPVLVQNEGGDRSGHWLQIKTVGTKSNRDAIGAWVAHTSKSMDALPFGNARWSEDLAGTAPKARGPDITIRLCGGGYASTILFRTA